MSGEVIRLRIEQRERVPDHAVVDFDLGTWAMKLFCQGRFLRRVQCIDEAAAREAVRRFNERRR